MKRILLFAITLFLSYSPINAQDIHFSQFFASPITLNPAMTGMMNGCYRGAINFRNQWASIPAPFTTVAASYDMPLLRGVIGSDYIGVGALIFNDQAGYGDLNNLSVLGSVAYHKAFDREARYVLSIGAQGGLVHKSVQFAQLIFESQILAASGSGLPPSDFPNFEAIQDNAFNYFDIRVGGMFTATPVNSFSLFLGGALYHLTEPNESFLQATNILDQRTVFHAGARIQPTSGFSVNPNAIYMTQSGSQEIVVGANLGYHFDDGLSYRGESNTAVYLGVSVRLEDAIIPLLGIDYNDFKFGLTYDINISSLNEASLSQGGIELSLVYESSCYPPSRRSYPPVHCPRF